MKIKIGIIVSTCIYVRFTKYCYIYLRLCIYFSEKKITFVAYIHYCCKRFVIDILIHRIDKIKKTQKARSFTRILQSRRAKVN